MKTRIIGSIIVLIILGGLFVVSEQDSPQQTTPSVAPMTNNDSAFKSLSIN